MKTIDKIFELLGYSEKITVHFDEGEIEIMQQAADMSGVALKEFIVRAAARQALEDVGGMCLERLGG